MPLSFPSWQCETSRSRACPYGVLVDEGVIVGDEPLADGMHLAVRIRRDFTVSDAARMLAAARSA